MPSLELKENDMALIWDDAKGEFALFLAEGEGADDDPETIPEEMLLLYAAKHIFDRADLRQAFIDTALESIERYG